MNYRIIPLVLSKYVGEKGVMTFLTDYGEPILRPFVMWCIQGADKNIIVDTAIEVEDYKNYHPDFRNLSLDTVMTFDQALSAVNLTADEVDIVIQTHLHFDHCFNTARCVNAKVLVQKDELEFAQAPGPFEGVYRSDLFKNLDFQLISGDHKLFDGIELIHVPGHSPGCQAVSVRTDKGTVVISGFCSVMENFYPEKAHPMVGNSVVLPGIFTNALEAYQSVLKVRERADIILPLHDPDVVNMSAIP